MDARRLRRRVIHGARRTVLHVEEYLAATIALSSTLWTVQLVTANFSGLARIRPLPPEVSEFCALASLIWLHARWRRVVTAAKTTVGNLMLT